MDIRIIDTPITRAKASDIAKEFYGDMVKGVVDIEREIIALGGKWHIDANSKIMEGGANQSAVWGFNLYPSRKGEDRIEYIALINIRPALGNSDMYIEDAMLRERMREIINRLVP